MEEQLNNELLSIVSRILYCLDVNLCFSSKLYRDQNPMKLFSYDFHANSARISSTELNDEFIILE